MASPTCKICGRSEDVQFAIFNPAIPPFGTACVVCEEKVKENLATLATDTENPPLGIPTDAKPADCEICENGEVLYHGELGIVYILTAEMAVRQRLHGISDP